MSQAEAAAIMTKFWWVNHKQTHRQEISGEYLWSPKVEKNGAKSRFYDNMRLAAPGEYVLSMANGRVAHIGCVTDYAISSPKPEEFGKIGDYWQHEGWLLPVTWTTLPTPVRPKEMVDQIAPLLRERYAPIQKDTGNGNQKAYLAEIDESLFCEIVEHAQFVGLDALKSERSARARGEFAASLEAAVLSKIESNPDISATEKLQLRKSRVGQGAFRKNVLAITPTCCVSGINNPDFLIASHIKPWRSCETSHERLDGYNGLLLAPHVDFLFDRGLIGFNNSGEILLSSTLELADIDLFGITAALEKPCLELHPQHIPYFDYHRRNVFII